MKEIRSRFLKSEEEGNIRGKCMSSLAFGVGGTIEEFETSPDSLREYMSYEQSNAD